VRAHVGEHLSVTPLGCRRQWRNRAPFSASLYSGLCRN
jgi:hypothetical protein